MEEITEFNDDFLREIVKKGKINMQLPISQCLSNWRGAGLGDPLAVGNVQRPIFWSHYALTTHNAILKQLNHDEPHKTSVANN